MSPEQAIADDVRQRGHSLISISDIDPPFAYTVGLMFTHQHPELIVFGLRQAGPDILRAMIKLLSSGRRFESPDEYELVPTVRIATRPVHPTQHELYLGYAMGNCREQGRPGGLHAVEVFWPDKQGRFPVRPGCDESVWRQQPRLDQALGPVELEDRRSERSG